MLLIPQNAIVDSQRQKRCEQKLVEAVLIASSGDEFAVSTHFQTIILTKQMLHNVVNMLDFEHWASKYFDSN